MLSVLGFYRENMVNLITRMDSRMESILFMEILWQD